MATNFPTSLDSYSALVDGTDVLEAADQNNVRDAIEAIEAKVGIDSSAVTSSHDYKIAQLEGGVVQENGSTVFNQSMGTANTFQDLDLSATVGARYVVVFLEVAIPATGSTTFYIAKTKGYGSATFTQHYQSGGNPNGGCIMSAESGETTYSQMTLMTDGAGVIQHGFTDNSTTITVKLIGFIQ
jgi:hypothetical protein